MVRAISALSRPYNMSHCEIDKAFTRISSFYSSHCHSYVFCFRFSLKIGPHRISMLVYVPCDKVGMEVTFTSS